MYNEKNIKSKRINRPHWAIIIKYEGETVYKANGRTYISNKENIAILPKGSSYEWLCTKSGHVATIEFDCETMCSDIFSFRVKDGEKILKLFKELEYKRTMKNPIYKMESIRDCYTIILNLIQAEKRSYLPSCKLQKITPAMDYIAKNYSRNITNDELANLIGVSTVYFRKLFTEVVGTSPIAYVHKLRIKKAKEMLKSDYGSISDIAYSLGYLSVYDFSRTFKKHTGIPPSKF
jgi:YesN/AraC family two-component response regulator